MLLFLFLIHSCAVISINRNKKEICSQIILVLQKDMVKPKIYSVEMMEEGLRKYFLSNYPNSSPGIVCSQFQKKDRLDCAVLVANDKTEASLLKLIIGINMPNPQVKEMEIYLSKKYLNNNVFLRFLSKSKIPDREGPSIDSQVMMGSDGFEIVYFEKTSIAFFWESGKLKRIRTSD